MCARGRLRGRAVQFGPWTRLAKAPNAHLVELGIGDVDDDGAIDLLSSPSGGDAALVLATGPRTWPRPGR